jgi:glyoxylase-like metal-dependent hydrolase (beta-lactamase superfamily II)
VYAWLQRPPGHGRANAGVVVDADGLTLVDTLMVPSQVEPFAEAIAAFELPVPRVVLTSSLIPFVGGSAWFQQAAFYGSEHTSDLLDLPANVPGYRLLHPDFAAEFADDLATRPVSHVVDAPAALSDAVEVIPVVGPSPGNLVGLVPGAGICFAGELCSFGVTPLGFEADFEAWLGSLDALVELAPVIVPGVGAVGGRAEVEALAGYLRACLEARGDVDRLPAGPWDGWADRHFDEVNVERAAASARGDDQVPEAMLRLIGLR